MYGVHKHHSGKLCGSTAPRPPNRCLRNINVTECNSPGTGSHDADVSPKQCKCIWRTRLRVPCSTNACDFDAWPSSHITRNNSCLVLLKHSLTPAYDPRHAVNLHHQRYHFSMHLLDPCSSITSHIVLDRDELYGATSVARAS